MGLTHSLTPSHFKEFTPHFFLPFPLSPFFFFGLILISISHLPLPLPSFGNVTNFHTLTRSPTHSECFTHFYSSLIGSCSSLLIYINPFALISLSLTHRTHASLMASLAHSCLLIIRYSFALIRSSIIFFSLMHFLFHSQGTQFHSQYSRLFRHSPVHS